MKGTIIRKILLLGVGNDLRGDDALGYYLINEFDIDYFKSKITKNRDLVIDKITVRYLDYDISESLVKYDLLVFVDTAINIKSVFTYKLDINKLYFNYSFSHNLTIENILLYTKSLYGKVPVCFIILIGGYNFEYGQNISDLGKINFNLANKILHKLIDYIINKNI